MLTGRLFVEGIKRGVLTGLQRNGYGFVQERLTPHAVRALAELVAEGLIRDETDEHGRFVIRITRAGLDRAAALSLKSPRD